MATHIDLDKIIEAGEKLGYTGQELRDFVTQERLNFTEQRAAEREARALEREENEKQRQAQRLMVEENEKQRQAQLAVLTAEKQKLELEIEADHRKLDMQLELEQMKRETSELNASIAAESVRAKPPKLPLFNEDRDQLDMYLQRFERYAVVQNWNREEWAFNLSSLLTGKALNVYSSIPIEDAHDYVTLKRALLKAYNLTEDGYKQKFRSSKPESCETATQFIARLKGYLVKWLDSANVDRSFEAILEFFVKDQFLQIIPPDMGIFVREREPRNTSEMAAVSERYLNAHGGWQRIPRTQTKNRVPIVTRRVGDSLISPLKRVVSSTEQRNSPNTSDKSSGEKRTCHFCHKPGHFWRNCPVAPKSFVPSMAMIIDVMKEEFSTQEDDCDENCENCPTTDVNSCNELPNENDDKCTNINPSDDVIEASFLRIDSENDHHVERALQKGHFDLKCGHRLPLMTAACSDKISNMPVSDGYVGDVKVRVLRDSGCSGAVVKSHLVTGEQLTGEYKSCVLIDGTIRRFPVATIQVDTPFYTGNITALCMKNPVYDLVLGNIDGVRHPSDPDVEWSRSQNVEKEKLDHAILKDTSAAVETRCQAKKRPVKPLKVDTPMGDIVSYS